MSELRNKVEMEIQHHISPLIGWLCHDAAKGKVDTDGTRYNQWKERAALAVDAIMEHVGEVEYEYNIEYTDTRIGTVFLFRETWEPDLEWLQLKIDGESGFDRRLEYKARLVKRRKAGKVEEL